jgi:tRNA modification GTPase
MLLESVVRAGARLARPGEFTERAFLEGRMDLAQAEAVADLIDAGSEQAALAAQATLRGEFSRRVEQVVARLTASRARLEASLDFADEELDMAGEALGAGTLDDIERALQATLGAARQGVRLRDGLRVALVGAPNVGKSSIMNRLAGEARAIVTPVPGTTRDVLREEVRIEGALVELLDTAGLHDSADEVERVGMERAREHAARADLLLLVTDVTSLAPAPLAGIAPTAKVVIVRNTVDLCDVPAGLDGGELRVSALTGAGFEELSALIARRASCQTGDGAFTARHRHVHALEEALQAVKRAQRQQGAGAELVAEELRHAQLALGRITGVVSSDDLLGEIFSTFCIGK